MRLMEYSVPSTSQLTSLIGWSLMTDASVTEETFMWVGEYRTGSGSDRVHRRLHSPVL